MDLSKPITVDARKEVSYDDLYEFSLPRIPSFVGGVSGPTTERTVFPRNRFSVLADKQKWNKFDTVVTVSNTPEDEDFDAFGIRVRMVTLYQNINNPKEAFDKHLPPDSITSATEQFDSEGKPYLVIKVQDEGYRFSRISYDEFLRRCEGHWKT